MISLSKFSFTFLQLLAGAVLIPAFVNRAVAAPTPGLQERGTSSTCKGVSRVAAGYYAGWTSSILPISQIPWSKYSHLLFSGATTQPNSTISLDSTSAGLLTTFVQEAHANGVNAILSIGGWSGSLHFSTSVEAQNLPTFVQAALDLVKQYDLDGLDFDWEYPTGLGIGCNAASPSDSTNFLQFIQQLRANNSDLILSAAVGPKPFLGSNGNPMTDVSGFGKALDFIAIMNYDVWGAFSDAVGPNSPLADSCAPKQDGSAISFVKAWTGAGFPSSKILLGTPTYGHGYIVPSSAALDSSGNIASYPPFSAASLPQGDRDSGTPTTDVCGNSVPGDTGIFTFEGMISKGFLDSSGDPVQGIDYRFDNCSQTPYVYQPSTQIMISYDNPLSYRDKASFILDQNLLGFSIWDLSGDSNNTLVDAISSPLGIGQSCL